MITRLAPWQRINIAIARGITLAPSGNMQWIANCTVFSVTPKTGQLINLIVPADSEIDAARAAAELCASRLYGDAGSASFITKTNGGPLYIATIGYYDNGVTKGRSIEILIRRYTHPVTGEEQ